MVVQQPARRAQAQAFAGFERGVSACGFGRFVRRLHGFVALWNVLQGMAALRHEEMRQRPQLHAIRQGGHVLPGVHAIVVQLGLLLQRLLRQFARPGKASGQIVRQGIEQMPVHGALALPHAPAARLLRQSAQQRRSPQQHLQQQENSYQGQHGKIERKINGLVGRPVNGHHRLVAAHQQRQQDRQRCQKQKPQQGTHDQWLAAEAGAAGMAATAVCSSAAASACKARAMPGGSLIRACCATCCKVCCADCTAGVWPSKY